MCLPADDVARLGQALGAGPHGERAELMASRRLQWAALGELAALTVAQVDPCVRVARQFR